MARHQVARNRPLGFIIGLPPVRPIEIAPNVRLSKLVTFAAKVADQNFEIPGHIPAVGGSIESDASPKVLKSQRTLEASAGLSQEVLEPPGHPHSHDQEQDIERQSRKPDANPASDRHVRRPPHDPPDGADACNERDQNKDEGADLP